MGLHLYHNSCVRPLYYCVLNGHTCYFAEGHAFDRDYLREHLYVVSPRLDDLLCVSLSIAENCNVEWGVIFPESSEVFVDAHLKLKFLVHLSEVIIFFFNILSV